MLKRTHPKGFLHLCIKPTGATAVINYCIHFAVLQEIQFSVPDIVIFRSFSRDSFFFLPFFFF